MRAEPVFSPVYRDHRPPIGRQVRAGLIGTLLLGVTLACGLPAAPGNAQATRWQDEEYGEGLEPFQADGPLIAVVSLGEQKINVWDRNGLVASTRISTGRKGYDTPEGVFSIIERKPEHYSNLYDDAAMPFMQRITWSGVALHEGAVPKYRASHGCIRLPGGFAERLFRTTQIATRVVIVPNDAKPLAIAHPALFHTAMAIPAAESVARANDEMAEAVTVAGPEAGIEMEMLTAANEAGKGAGAGIPASLAATTAVDAMVEKRRRHAALARQLADATQALAAARKTVRPRLIEQGRTEKAARMAIALARRAQGRADVAEQSWLAAGPETAALAAQSRHIELLMALALARGAEAEAREVAAQKAAAAHSIKDLVKSLDEKRSEVYSRSRGLWREMQPVSVLVSRATGRIYVRQAFRPLLELPATLKDDERPIGTHVFTALADTEDDDKLKWVAMTIRTPDDGIPASTAADEEPAKPRRGRKAQAAPKRPPADPLETARAALDRLVVPPEALARILGALQPGSTLIISDLGPSIETGPGTDLVVQTRGEAEAAENIRRFVARKRSEQVADRGDGERPRGRRESGRSGDWQRW